MQLSLRKGEDIPPDTHFINVVFITGIPSSGKSAVTKELVALAEEAKVVVTDAEIRKAGLGPSTLVNARRIFQHVLEKIEDLSTSGTVLVDGSLPGSYVEEARRRFGTRALFVSLRVSEHERRSRENSRSDRSPIKWNEGMTALQGADELTTLCWIAPASLPWSALNGLSKQPA